MRMRLCCIMLAALALVGCRRDEAADGQAAAAAEVLPGSASDAMIRYDALRSQPPFASDAAEPLVSGEPAESRRPVGQGAAPAPGDAPQADSSAAAASATEAGPGPAPAGEGRPTPGASAAAGPPD